MKYLHVLMGEDLQVEVLAILGGTVHGKASVAVAFPLPMLRTRKHYQAPGWLNAAYWKLQIGLTFTKGMVENGEAKWESEGVDWEKHGHQEASQKIKAWVCSSKRALPNHGGREEPELVAVISEGVDILWDGRCLLHWADCGEFPSESASPALQTWFCCVEGSLSWLFQWTGTHPSVQVVTE